MYQVATAELNSSIAYLQLKPSRVIVIQLPNTSRSIPSKIPEFTN
jgi:hypothetical protein